MKRVLILRAAGRDLHTFDVLFRGHCACHVFAFTTTQIPEFAGHRYPQEAENE